MDDLIVLILTLAIGVIGAISQVRKKKQQAGEPIENKEPGFWDMLEDELEYSPPAPQQKSTVAEPDFSPQPKKNTTYEFKAENEGKPALTDDLTKNYSDKNTGTEKDKEKFPLKKAVIYSEILNQKYI